MRPFVYALSALMLGSAGLSCAPPSREARVATTPPVGPVTAAQAGGAKPAAAQVGWAQSHFAASDGLQLYRQSWRPAGEPRAALVIQHGLKSHGGDYAGFAQALAARGYAVYAADLRGHGHSAGQRATLDDFDQLIRDLRLTMQHARSEVAASAPLLLMGHSVGGALATLYCERYDSELSGLVLLAPALRIDRSALEAAGTPFFSALLPNAPLVDVPDEWFSRSAKRRQEMGASDLVYHPAGPARTGGALLSALEEIWAQPERIRTPLLALHGTADKATDPRGSAEIVARAASSDKQLLLYRGLYHDLLHEPERAQVAEDITKWFEARRAAR